MKKAPPLLPEERPLGGVENDLGKAVKTPEKSTVKGKIVMVSPVRYRQDGSLAVRSLILKDTKATAKVCLFGQNAESHYQLGDVVKVTSVYPKKYNERMQLTTSPASSCELVGDDLNVTIDEADKEIGLADPDFGEPLPEDEKLRCIVLTDFTDGDVYSCCEMPPCKRKKLVNGRCPICSRVEQEQNMKTFRVHFLYKVEGEDIKDKPITLFQGTVEKVFGENVEVDDKEQLIERVIGKLPVKFKAVVGSNKNLYNIQA